ncbi:unnamed protein product [Brassica oleracea]
MMMEEMRNGGSVVFSPQSHHDFSLNLLLIQAMDSATPEKRRCLLFDLNQPAEPLAAAEAIQDPPQAVEPQPQGTINGNTHVLVTSETGVPCLVVK